MFEGQRVAVQRMTEHTRPLVAISKDPKEQHLSQTQPQITHMDGARGHTSISFVFKNGFLMYHVEVRKVSANITSSFFPESSRELGECLNPSVQSEYVHSSTWHRITER